MKRLLIPLLILQAVLAEGQTNVFPDFTDVLLIAENGEPCIYLEGGQKDTVRSLIDSLDDLPFEKKREGVLLRFDHTKVPLDFAVNVAQQTYRCGVPVIYLYDISRQYSETEIEADPYLFGLHRMPRHNKFLRILDLGSFLLLPSSAPRLPAPGPPSTAESILKVCLTALLTACCYAAGLSLSRLSRPWRAIGYCCALAVIFSAIVSRIIPGLEHGWPFRFLMASRTEYAALSMAVAFLLALPVRKLPRQRVAVTATAGASILTLYFCILPFLLPLFSRSELLSLSSTFDRYGVCIQNTGYTSGPASAVSALREFGISADEGVIAVFACSSSAAGTPPELLCSAINTLHGAEGIRSEIRTYDSPAELRPYLPVIATMKLGFFVDRYVTVLRVADDYITIADPSRGMCVVSPQNFELEWRSIGILMRKETAESLLPDIGISPIE